MKNLTLLSITALILISIAGSALAVPRLQTYIVDSRYYRHYNWLDNYSWITNSQDFDLKVVGYWDSRNYIWGGSSYLPTAPTRDFMDCYVAISVPKHEFGTVWINGVEINTFTNWNNAVPSGASPSWILRYTRPSYLGKFNFHSIGRIDNLQRNAWSYNYGSIMNPGWGDEILLDVVVKGFNWAHFDAIGIDSRGNTISNSYCRDASYFATPEPNTLSLLGLGLLGIAPLLRKKRR